MDDAQMQRISRAARRNKATQTTTETVYHELIDRSENDGKNTSAGSDADSTSNGSLF